MKLYLRVYLSNDVRQTVYEHGSIWHLWFCYLKHEHKGIYFLIIFASFSNKILWEINYISYMFSFKPQNNFYILPNGKHSKSKKGEQISTKGRVQHFWTTPTTSWVSYVSHLHYIDFKIPWYVTHALHWSVIYSISVLKRWEKNNIYVRRRYIKVIGNVIRSLV